jgi:protein-tyrosine phosphatase
MRVYWVKAELGSGRLGIAERPAGEGRLSREIKAMRAQGVDVLVSMLTFEEMVGAGLLDEDETCVAQGIVFHSLPVRDHSLPDALAPVNEMVERLRSYLQEGKSVAIHCWAGIGRSALMLASVLCGEGATPEQAFFHISRARGLQVPDTASQFMWVEAYAEHLRSLDEASRQPGT